MQEEIAQMSPTLRYIGDAAGYLTSLVFLLILPVSTLPSQTTEQSSENAKQDKPLVIDVRQGGSSSARDANLFVVDGVLRHGDSHERMKRNSAEEKHEIHPLTRKRRSSSSLATINSNNNDDSLRVNLLASMEGRESGDWFGESVSGVDDFDGDGYDDFVVGGPSNFGDVCIFYGGEKIDTIPDIWIRGDYSFGWSVAGAGDMNGDGFGDIVVGMDQYSPPYHAGATYVFFGGPLTGQYTVLVGDQEELHLGSAVASLEDINNDGYDGYNRGYTSIPWEWEGTCLFGRSHNPFNAGFSSRR